PHPAVREFVRTPREELRRLALRCIRCHNVAETDDDRLIRPCRRQRATETHGQQQRHEIFHCFASRDPPAAQCQQNRPTHTNEWTPAPSPPARPSTGSRACPTRRWSCSCC